MLLQRLYTAYLLTANIVRNAVVNRCVEEGEIDNIITWLKTQRYHFNSYLYGKQKTICVYIKPVLYCRKNVIMSWVTPWCGKVKYYSIHYQAKLVATRRTYVYVRLYDATNFVQTKHPYIHTTSPSFKSSSVWALQQPKPLKLVIYLLSTLLRTTIDTSEWCVQKSFKSETQLTELAQ